MLNGTLFSAAGIIERILLKARRLLEFRRETEESHLKDNHSSVNGLNGTLSPRILIAETNPNVRDVQASSVSVSFINLLHSFYFSACTYHLPSLFLLSPTATFSTTGNILRLLEIVQLPITFNLIVTH